MKWITRARPKIDRIACPWLIRRFIDMDAEILYVPFDQVRSKAEELGAIPFDIPDVEFTHYQDECTFDYFMKRYQINDPALEAVASIVRAADTERYDLASQASGLWAISSGLSHICADDHELLEKGMMLYDALYAWARHFQQERHTQNPVEQMLMEVCRKYLNRDKKGNRSAPAWVKELKALIQDQIDTDLNLSLKTISESLAVHPSYLSREFSKYFDNLSFGDYIRKLRIEKAIELMHTPENSLSDVAYMTGFSDQSHFTRVFKRHIGKNPSAFRKNLHKNEGKK